MEELTEHINELYHKSYPSKRQMTLLLESEGYNKDDIKDMIDKYYDNNWFGDIYKVRRKKIKHFSHFSETIVDRQHQMDLMEMPMDSRHKWTYLLDYIDVASRKGVCVGVTNKLPSSIVKALKKIFDTSPTGLGEHAMNRPKILQTDGGGEFKGVVDTYLEEQGIEHRATIQKNHQAIVERFNQTIAKPLFRYMDSMEHNGAERREDYRFNRWSDILDNVIDEYNNRYHHGIKAVPNVIYDQGFIEPKVDSKAEYEQSDDVEIDTHEIDEEEEILPNGTEVRKIIDRPNTQHVRATDPRWSANVYMVMSKHRKSESDPYKYRLMNKDMKIVNDSYYRDELMVVNDGTDVKGYTMSRYAA